MLAVKNKGSVKTICYGQERIWNSRKEAADFFLQAISETEGGECDRYMNIYTKLIMGYEVCTDESRLA